MKEYKLKIINTPHDVICWRQKIHETVGRDDFLGLVPTMGGLHEGHLALIERSMRENPFTIVSIFLNPTQFSDKADLERYPNDLENDLKKLGKIKIDAVFVPSYSEIYPDHYQYIVMENQLSKELCGKSKKGHFDGVLTVVLKLINIASPHRVYFGEKDYQQLELIRGMVDALFLPVQVVACPTVRAVSGLALSSRNQHLSSKGKKEAAFFLKVLKSYSTREKIIKNLEQKNFEIDYIEERAGRRYGAVFMKESG